MNPQDRRKCDELVYCPKCGEAKVMWILLHPSPMIYASATEPVFECPGCGTKWRLGFYEVEETAK